uniref:Uncharacterized protein n=1 Tax=Branchiostoma floridae TaxID=7739 RepID=C3Z7V6_BRAFL|eukprot:XP_002595449.1 hypothetical protein BRAFLDRAFT_69281 [Branchiostoma floridae]
MEKRTAFTLAIPLCVLFNVLFLRFSPIIIITSSEYSHPIILCRHGNTDCTNEPTYQTTHINWNGSEFIDVQTGRPTAKKNALYCRLKKVRFSTMTRTLPPPSNGSVLNPYFPSESLENLVRYNSCAVVSSSHGLKLHNYGHDIGVVMMLHLCDWVYTYEIVPSSVDKTRLAYYYSGNITKNHNAFHSIATERQYFRTLTVTPPDEVERTGVAVFRGLSQYNCT